MIKIDILRAKYGISYNEISEMIGCSKTFAWQLINGKRTLSYKNAVLIAVVKENGVLTNLVVSKKIAKTGNTEYSEAIKIPEKGKNPTLEIYVLDTVNKKTPYSGLVSLPEKNTTILKKTKKNIKMI